MIICFCLYCRQRHSYARKLRHITAQAAAHRASLGHHSTQLVSTTPNPSVSVPKGTDNFQKSQPVLHHRHSAGRHKNNGSSASSTSSVHRIIGFWYLQPHVFQRCTLTSSEIYVRSARMLTDHFLVFQSSWFASAQYWCVSLDIVFVSELFSGNFLHAISYLWNVTRAKIACSTTASIKLLSERGLLASLP